MHSITILICTHNREVLLSRVLDSLNSATQPSCGAEILVVANACTDGTHSLLKAYAQVAGNNALLSVSEFPGKSDTKKLLPLRWIVEPTPGKTHALN